VNRHSALALATLLATSAAASTAMAQMPANTMAMAPAAMPAAITATRPAADVDRDAARKPVQVIAFAGVKPGMTVAELGPGGGYYTRMLSAAVGPTGKVYALASNAQAARPGGLDGLNALAAVLPNVKVLAVDYTNFTLPEKADVAWTTENYHDYHNGPTANVAGLNKSVFANLKAGGTFYVEDHSSAPGAGLEATSKLHRMDVAVAKTELTAAGFKVDGESDLLHNAADDRAKSNSEQGHFVTERFMLRLKRP